MTAEQFVAILKARRVAIRTERRLRVETLLREDQPLDQGLDYGKRQLALINRLIAVAEKDVQNGE